MQPTLPISICMAETAEGHTALVTLAPPGTAMSRGLSPEEIIGKLIDPSRAEEGIDPDNFARNPAFVEFLHKVIKQFGPTTPGLIAAAKDQIDGWVYLLDGRTSTPQGSVPPEDVIGVFQAQSGQIVPGSYQGNPNHRVLSHQGFFRLEPKLERHLLDELANRA